MGETRPAVSRGEPLQARPPRWPLWADGAMGTMLTTVGLPPGDPPEYLNLSRPDAVAAVHAAYLAVGCDLVSTNTFGGNRLRLSAHGLEREVETINRTAVAIARAAGSGDHLVAGVVGPTGGFERGRRTRPKPDIRAALEEQMAILVQAGVDLLLIETMTHVSEASAALEASGGCAPVPVAVTLVFFDARGDLRTLDGASPRETVRTLAAAAMVGCNCVDIELAGEILHQMAEATALPLIAQPHAGLPGVAHTPNDMAQRLPVLLVPQVSILGGCCGTTPEHLQAFIHATRCASFPPSVAGGDRRAPFPDSGPSTV
jgi:5-methyltetrahydrofolate--homocysteine methyltransferase